VSSLVLLWVVVGSLAVTCLTAIGARALRDFSRHELGEICRRRDAGDRFGQILRKHNQVAQGVENFLTLCTTLLVVAGTFWVFKTRPESGGGGWPIIVAETLVLGLAVSAVKLWVPWAIVRLWAEPVLYYAWPLWQLLGRAMLPLVWGGRVVDIVAHRLAGRSPEVANGETLEEEIRTIISEGHREGLLEEDAREMIEGVIDLGDADVAEIMTPRTDMHVLHVDAPWDEMLNYVIEMGHTRVPVYEKNRDDIIGILYSKDLLPVLAKGSDRPPLRKLLRKPHFVPETKAVDDLLEEFQQKRNHMAVVLDEYGGVSGLVTIEDVLEEIVGEIVDEYDEELVEEISRIDESSIEALGRAHVDEINEMLGLDLPDNDDFDTIGGFVFTELGRIPSNGETVEWNDKVRITVLEATPRRIERVRIELIDTAAREIA